MWLVFDPGTSALHLGPTAELSPCEVTSRSVPSSRQTPILAARYTQKYSVYRAAYPTLGPIFAAFSPAEAPRRSCLLYLRHPVAAHSGKMTLRIRPASSTS